MKFCSCAGRYYFGAKCPYCSLVGNCTCTDREDDEDDHDEDDGERTNNLSGVLTFNALSAEPDDGLPLPTINWQVPATPKPAKPVKRKAGAPPVTNAAGLPPEYLAAAANPDAGLPLPTIDWSK